MRSCFFLCAKPSCISTRNGFPFYSYSFRHIVIKSVTPNLAENLNGECHRHRHIYGLKL